MGNVKFYLKKAEPGKKGRLIYLQFKYNGKRLVFSFGQSIDPGPFNKTKKDFKNWNPHTCRVKENKDTLANGDHSLNALFDELETICIKAYKKEVVNGIPAPATLKKYLQDHIDQNNDSPEKPSLFKLIDRFINNEIQFKGKLKQKETLKKYTTVKNHLREFEKTNGPVNFDSINLDFYYKFTSFLRTTRTIERKGKKISSPPLSNNSIAKDIQMIKAFMNEAVDLGYTTNMQHKHKKFSTPWEDVENIYLSESEIEKLYKHDLSNSKRLEEARDLFVFGCFVGLRYSDYSNVQPENIINNEGDLFIKMITKKTKELVYVPCHPLVLQIFDKYKDRSNRLPKNYSIQKFNEYLKECCKLAGLKEVGRLINNPGLELWQCISSHTARRSFATNLYLQGFPTIGIMKITGHRTEKSFMKYINQTKLDAAKKMNTHMKERWNKKLLRIAG